MRTLSLVSTAARPSDYSLQNNLVRCSFGAGAVSVVDLMLKRLGTGWTYVLLSGICIVFSPAYFILMHYGPTWRAKRRARRQAAEASKA